MNKIILYIATSKDGFIAVDRANNPLVNGAGKQ